MSSRLPRSTARFVIALVMVGWPAHAQAVHPPPDTAPELAAADACARVKDWAGALAHAQAADKLSPSVKSQIGIAEALYQLGRTGEAYDAFNAVRTGYGAKLSTVDKALVGGRLKALAQKTGWLSVRAEPGASVELDEKSIGISPVPALLRVAIGPHHVRVLEPGSLPFEARPEVAPDGTTVVDASLVRVPTRGRLVVRSHGEPLRVLLDGVDVGVTPWEGDVPAGTHDVAGRSSTSAAPAQTISLAAGVPTTVELVGSSTAAHLQIRTSDGQGQIVVDGAAQGQGAYSGEVAPGAHTILVSRDGYQPFQKSLSVAPQETWAETVTLSPVVVATTSAATAERAFEGVYGGVGFTGLFGVGGQGTELETNCDALGASSCRTPSPLGAGVFGYAGWTWNPVGFELLVGGSFDTTKQTATFDGSGRSGNSPLSAPARTETFMFYRAGGLAAVRARVTFAAGSRLRVTGAGGLGFSYKQLFMVRRAIATSGGGQDVYVADSVGYFSPAVTADVGLEVRLTPTMALAVGALLWADNASIAGQNAVPPQTGRRLTSSSGQLPQPLATPGYHLASGPQVFLGPTVGLQFGP